MQGAKAVTFEKNQTQLTMTALNQLVLSNVTTLLFNLILCCLHIVKPRAHTASGLVASPRKFLQKYAFSYHLLHKTDKNKGSVCQKKIFLYHACSSYKTPQLLISTVQPLGLVADQVLKAVSINSKTLVHFCNT